MHIAAPRPRSAASAPSAGGRLWSRSSKESGKIKHENATVGQRRGLIRKVLTPLPTSLQCQDFLCHPY